MAAFLAQALARNVRSADALITAGELGFLRQLLQFVSNDCAAREKHGKSWPDVVVENEKFEFFAELAMVALLCFLEHREVIVEFLFRFECRAVNALQLRILFVAFIISARHVRELERADVSRAHDVRACAEINELTAASRPFLPSSNASSRETSMRSNGWFALISFFISASIFSKSSGEMRCGRSTS